MKLKTENEDHWTPVKGFEKTHLVSRCGKIKNLRTGNTLKGSLSSRGYIRVFLSVNGKSLNRPAHVIALESFSDRPSELHEVNHIDFDKTNNNLENLEWVTRQENILHNFIGGKIRHGENCNLSKLDEPKVLAILTMGINKNKEIKESYSISDSTIYRIRKGKLWNRIYKNAV